MGKINKIETFADYMEDETRVTPTQKSQIEFETALISKLIEAREHHGISQRELARLSGIKQPVIARIETMKSTPNVSTLFKVLEPLGYKISIVPANE